MNSSTEVSSLSILRLFVAPVETVESIVVVIVNVKFKLAAIGYCIEDLHVLEEMIYGTNKMQNVKRGENRNRIDEMKRIFSGEVTSKVPHFRVLGVDH